MEKWMKIPLMILLWSFVALVLLALLGFAYGVYLGMTNPSLLQMGGT